MSDKIETVTSDEGTLIMLPEYAQAVKEGNAYARFEDLLGKNVYIRTVTMYFVGRVVSVDNKNRTVTIDHASWIASTGRFGEFLARGPGAISESEPYPQSLPVVVSRDTIVDYNEWRHELPEGAKSGN